jgi:hypothetical protein
MSVFRSLTNPSPAQLVNQRQTAEEMASDLAVDTCLRYKEMRAEALQAEANAELPAAWSPEAKECMDTLEALLKGRHRWVVLPIVLEHFPELVRPATPQERAASEQVAESLAVNLELTKS